MLKASLTAAAVAAATVALGAPALAAPDDTGAAPPAVAPAPARQVRDGDVVPGRYVVLLDLPRAGAGAAADTRRSLATSTTSAVAAARRVGVRPDAVMPALGAYAGPMTAAQARALAAQPGIARVVPDRVRLAPGATAADSVVTVTDDGYDQLVTDGSAGRTVILNVGGSSMTWTYRDMLLRNLNRADAGAWTLGRLDDRAAPRAAAAARVAAGRSGDLLVAFRDGAVVGVYQGAPMDDAATRAWVAQTARGTAPAPTPTPTPTSSPTTSPGPRPTSTSSPTPTSSPTTSPTSPLPSPTRTTPVPTPTSTWTLPAPRPGGGEGWHLDRIDQRQTALDGRYAPVGQGKGVHVYVVDSGVTATHEDFAGRMSSQGFTAIDDGRGTGDCYSHGTHVASIAAGARHGVAKEATVHAVRIFDCRGYGTDSGDLEAVDWVVQHAERPAVLNASWGGSAHREALTRALTTAMEQGITVAAAAGNASNDACTMFPANVPGVINVGATSPGDTLSGFTGRGSCVDVFAPGTNVVAARNDTTDGTVTKSGTSMATPVVSGAAAVYLGLHPQARPAEVQDWIVRSSTEGVIRGISDASPNRLVYVGPEAR